MRIRVDSRPGPRATFAVAAVLTAIFGVVDWASGYELQFFVFYFIPIATAGWICGARRAYAIAALSAATWFTSDLFSQHPYTHGIYAAWNTIIRPRRQAS